MRTMGKYKNSDIRLTDLYVSETYAGWLATSRLKEVNESIMEKIPKSVEKIFGEDRPVHIVEENKLDYSKYLPPVRVIAWFSCSEVVIDKGENGGSHLIMVWFQEQKEDPFYMATAHLNNIDWLKKAKDFSY